MTNLIKILTFLLVAGLTAACATTAGLLGFEHEADKAVEVTSCDFGENLLKRWSTISGVLNHRVNKKIGQTISERVRLISPVSVAAQSTDVFIADTGHKKIFKYRRSTQTIETFADVADMGAKVNLHIDRGLSVYLVDQSAGTTTQFDLDGRIFKVFENSVELPKPVDVTVDDRNAEILIAEQLRAQVLVFKRDGSISNVLNAPKEGVDKIQNIGAIAFAKNQLYLVDPVGHQVYAMSATGKLRYTFGEKELVVPSAITVDGENRVFVADTSNNTIKVYQGGLFIEELTGSEGSSESEFQLLSDIWADGDLLYVADAASASIKIFKILPSCD